MASTLVVPALPSCSFLSFVVDVLLATRHSVLSTLGYPALPILNSLIPLLTPGRGY